MPQVLCHFLHLVEEHSTLGPENMHRSSISSSLNLGWSWVSFDRWNVARGTLANFGRRRWEPVVLLSPSWAWSHHITRRSCLAGETLWGDMPASPSWCSIPAGASVPGEQRSAVPLQRCPNRRIRSKWLVLFSATKSVLSTF